MTIKNRYSDPAIGQAFENIAGLFAPMSGSDLAGYAAADANRQNAMQKAQQIGLTDMFMQSEGINDKAGIGAGLYTPNQSMRAVEMGDATNRYGYDQSAAAARHGHNQSLAGTMYSADQTLRGTVMGNIGKPVGQGEVAVIPDEILDWAGVPDASYSVTGASKPLSYEEVKGGLLQGAADNDDEFGRWVAGGSKDPLAVVGPEGPVMAAPDRASGMGVYEEPSEPNTKLTNVIRPDGSRGTALQTPQGLVNPSTMQPEPPGTEMFGTNVQGSQEDTLGRTSEGKVQLELIDNTSTQDVGNRVIELVSQNPASQGAVGWVRSKAQDLMQTGSEVGAYFGGEIQKVTQEVTNGVADATLMAPGGAFDTSLPAIDLMMNLYVYNYAKSITGERLSNEAVRQWRSSMGLDNALGNQANTLARLTEAQRSLGERETRLRSSLGGVVPPANPAPGGPPAPINPGAPAPAVEVGTVDEGYRFIGGDPANPNSWEPVQ